MHLYLVRHAMASHNVPGDPSPGVSLSAEADAYRLSHGDTPLTAQGLLQAELLGKRLADTAFDAVISSPLLRAVATAHAVVRHQKRALSIELLPDLAECSTHDYAGMPHELLSRMYPGVLPCEETQPTGAPARFPEESPEDMRRRAERVREYLLHRFNAEDRVLLVSHGAFLGEYLLHALLDIPASPLRFQPGFENASLTKLTLETGKPPLMMLLDDVSHLGKYRSRDLFLLDMENVDTYTEPVIYPGK